MTNLRLLVPAVLVAVAVAAPPASSEKSFISGPLRAKSYSKLTFGPDGILFIGDSMGARIYAVDLEDRTPLADPPKLAVSDLEGKIGGMLGVNPGDVLIHDMAVNPISKNTYLTVSRGRRNFNVEWQLPNDVANASILLRITPAGAIQEVRLTNVKHSFVDVANPATALVEIDWKKSNARVDTISDMAYAGGKLYVAGLSNEEFSSTMRVYSFPFDGLERSTSLEIYHGSHGKYETDAPVRTFLPIKIQGKPSLLASYLCTPLVWFPIDDLKDKKHVKGTTIGELGGGNNPLDMVAFRYKGQDHVMVVNSSRGILMFKVDDLQKALPSITTPVEDTAGVPFRTLRNRGILRADNFGDKNLLFLARNPLSGQVSLSTMPLEDQ
jgi:hypothetical protein